MSPGPKPDPTTKKLLAGRIKAVFRRLPRGMAGHEEDLHQLRVASRRLRVALPLLALKPEGRRMRRALRGLRQLVRAGGGARDLDVMLPLLEERVRSELAPCHGLLSARRVLRAAHTRSRSQIGDSLMGVEIARLRRDLDKVQKKGCEELSAVVTRLRVARESEGGAVMDALQGLGVRYDPEALHGLRRGVRRLRYLAEVQADVLGGRLSAPRLLKQLQSQLGLINDSHVLAEWLERFGASAERRGRLELASEVRGEQEHFRSRCLRLHREFLGSEPERLMTGALRELGGPVSQVASPGPAAAAQQARQSW